MQPRINPAPATPQHVVEVNPRTHLVSVLGGKWTTYRRMAEDAVDAVRSGGGAAEDGGRHVPCTAILPRTPTPVCWVAGGQGAQDRR